MKRRTPITITIPPKLFLDVEIFAEEEERPRGNVFTELITIATDAKYESYQQKEKEQKEKEQKETKVNKE